MALKKKPKPRTPMQLQEVEDDDTLPLTAADVAKPITPAPTSSGRFDYVRYDEIAQAKSAAIKAKAIELERAIEEAFGACPVSIKVQRMRDKAIDALEESYMWCGKAIRNEQVISRTAELQEERSHG